VARRSAWRGVGQGGVGARRHALPARVWRAAARGGLSVWRPSKRKRRRKTGGGTAPKHPGGKHHKGGNSTRGNPPANRTSAQQSPVWCGATHTLRPRLCRGTVQYCTSCATFPLSAYRKSGTTGTVLHVSSTGWIVSKRTVPICPFSFIFRFRRSVAS